MRAAPTSRNAPSRSRRRAQQLRRRRARRRLTLGIALVGALAVVGGVTVNLLGQDGTPGGSGPTAQARAIPPLGETPAPDAIEPSAAPPSTQPGSTPPSTPAQANGRGKGTFTTAAANGAAVGHGTIRRYKVEVEDGIGIDPQATAAQIHSILSDKRSWTTDGRNGFQLVSDGTYDFTVKIASPETVDKICATAGLSTGGEVNCDVGRQVMVNIKRWTSGSPQFTGSIDDYRALIVNHEVGHRIGHGHEGCPGKGKLAPAMMQQIYGLNGCLPNAWPYTADGTYISGPSVP
ncbi:DUF3152 domain-containing protein [Kitasatospora atroaurantiaca]|uniref:Uncharacterized protein DUF3152 n=1 Tax=Kitasatospora atroaurantiaca TaxID=285545 RepID=A0A561ESC6_9ACTN|nr:DUF3152 domain-containing protein [Kitasatospora atroaurantiaca]TWE18513.1 uncharacterized protein DUF3152 [Kitasatospora atroaurantiaca]